MKVLLVSTKNNDWVITYRAINHLLSYGLKVLWSKGAIQEPHFQEAPGAFIIPINDITSDNKPDHSLQTFNPLTQEKILKFFKSKKIIAEKVEITKHINVSRLYSTRIALYQDSGCYSHALVLSAAGFDLDWVTGMEISSGILDSYDILMSGGGGRALKANINRENLLLASMGVIGAKKVNEFVKNGGAYFGFCGGSYIGSVVRERFMNWWHPAKKNMTMMNVEDYYIDENSDSGFKSPGQGVFIAKNAAPENPIMFGLPDLFECVHWNGPVWNILEAAVDNASSPKSIVELKEVKPDKYTPSEFFKTNKSQNTSNIKKTGFYKACKKGKTTIAQGFYGTGLVILSGSHPERITSYSEVLNKNKIWDSAQILCNASFWAPTISNKEKKKSEKKYSNFIIPFQSTDEELLEKLKRVKENIIKFTHYDLEENHSWLDQNHYSLSFGLAPKKMYGITLEIIPKLCNKIEMGLTNIDKLVEKTKEILNEIKKRLDNKNAPRDQTPRVQTDLNLLFENGIKILYRYFSLLGKQKEPLWDQGGKQVFQGIYDNIRMAEEHVDKAINGYQSLSNKIINTSSSFANNPFTCSSSVRTRLEYALIQIWVCEADLSRFMSLWKLYSY